VIETLTVVAIFGIMAMVAAPSSCSLMASKRADTAATDRYVAQVHHR
jgi:Tfp pilus assembly protein FimT